MVVPTPEISKGGQIAGVLAGGQPRLHSMGKIELNTVEDAALGQGFSEPLNASEYPSRVAQECFPKELV